MGGKEYLRWSWCLDLGIFRRDPYAQFLWREKEVEQTWHLTGKDKQRGEMSSSAPQGRVD